MAVLTWHLPSNPRSDTHRIPKLSFVLYLARTLLLVFLHLPPSSGEDLPTAGGSILLRGLSQAVRRPETTAWSLDDANAASSVAFTTAATAPAAFIMRRRNKVTPPGKNTEATRTWKGQPWAYRSLRTGRRRLLGHRIPVADGQEERRRRLHEIERFRGFCALVAD